MAGKFGGFTPGLKGCHRHGALLLGAEGRVALAREWRDQWQVPTLAWRRVALSMAGGQRKRSFIAPPTECIQRAGCAARRHLEHVGVNHGGADIRVTQQPCTDAEYRCPLAASAANE